MEVNKYTKPNFFFKGLFISIILVTSFYTPTFSKVVSAQQIPNAVDIIKPLITAAELGVKVRETADKLKPSVPTQDKTTSKTDFIAGIALRLSQMLINRMVDSTITWANSGFDGNPAYTTNPKEYFIGLADNTATEFIEGTELDFLCSPFQKSIRISLQKNYYTPPQENYQCTWSEAWGNMSDFIDGNFKEGGWEAWFNVTQNPSNNPYGAFLTAKAEVDSRVANALSIQELELNWNQGYLSVKPCLRRASGTEECVEWGSTRTPGGLVKSGIETHINSEFAQLLDVQRFDQLLGALMGGLMQKYIFSSEGLFRGDKKELKVPEYQGYEPPVDNTNNAISLSCFTDQTRVEVGVPVTWTAQSDLGEGALYFWNGNEIPAGSIGSTITVTYKTSGTKEAEVSSESLNDTENILGASTSCSNSVVVTDIGSEQDRNLDQEF